MHPAAPENRPGTTVGAPGSAAVSAPGPVLRPGVIAPYGFLVGVDGESAIVDVASDNLGGFLGVEAADALGRTLTALLGRAVTDHLPPPLPSGRGNSQPLTIRLPPAPRVPVASATPGWTDGTPSRRPPWNQFEVITHRDGNRWIYEFEPAAAEQPGMRSLHDSFRRTLDHLRTIDAVDALCSVAAQEIRALTGFDRVVVHRFTEEGDREVVAEARRSDMAPYLGLSYRAADLSPQARDALLRGGLRLVADVDDDPVGLLYAADPAERAGSDRTVSVLRGVPVADRQRLRDQAVAATMTVSLVVDGRLWGLVLCEHESPRRIAHHVRASCEMLGWVLALQVRAAQARVQRRLAAQLGDLAAAVVTAMSVAETSGAAAAAAVPGALLGMVAADGVVLQVEGDRISLGRTPPESDIDSLLAGVVALAGRHVPPWTTDSLPAMLERDQLAGHPGGPAATGALYLPLGGPDNGFALWLRDEKVRTVSWAGEPGGAQGSAAGPDPAVAAPHPAVAAPAVAAPAVADPAVADAAVADTSVPVWEEVVRHRSAPWGDAERGAAEAFAKGLPALLLHRAHRLLLEHEASASAERVTAAAERQQLEQQLEQHERLDSLGRRAAAVAHDFKNILAVIQNYAEFIGDAVDAVARAEEGADWSPVQSDVERIKEATARADDLTKHLLAFARGDIAEPRPFNLNHVIGGLEHLLRRSLGRTVDLTTDLAERPHSIIGDPGQVEQILLNLAVNARDAMPAGGSVAIDTADVVVNERQPPADAEGLPEPSPAVPAGEYVRLRVRDTGAGIPREIADRIFEPFFTTKPVGEGTGLGLATVHAIVVQMQGSIEIESSVGQGTTFTIFFPATQALPVIAPPPAAGRPRGGGETILVVDDGAELREVTCRLLRRTGYQVLSAANGYEALQVAAGHDGPLDLLLIDLMMPFMSGDQVAETLRSTHPDIRVLFMSGYASSLSATGGAPKPQHLLLEKPFSRSTLLIKVLEVLDKPPVRAVIGSPLEPA